MLKEQTVTKYLILLSFLSSFNFLYGQKKLKGKYSRLATLQEHYNYLDFKENGTFEYHAGASLGDDEFGKGNYQIKNDSLFLNYNLTELKEESYFIAKKYYNTKDSIKVNLNIYNFNKEPLYNIIVDSYPNHLSTESSKKGFACLKLKKGSYKEKIEIYIDGEFFAKQIIYLDSDTNYNLDVFMSNSISYGFGHPKAIKNQMEKYKIIEISKEFLKVEIDNKVMKLIRISK